MKRTHGFSMIAVTGALIVIGLLMMAALHLVLDHRRLAALSADYALAMREAEAALAAAECRLAAATRTPGPDSCRAEPDTEHAAALDPVTLAGFAPGHCGSGAAQGLCWPLAGQSAQTLAKLLDAAPDAVVLDATPTPALRQPMRPARYVIEPIPDTQAGQWMHAGTAPAPRLFRITAAGFGTDAEVSVTLQTVYRPRVAGP